MSDSKPGSREDVFRDYEQRDIRDGWPYSDKDGDRYPRRNAPYGAPDADLDHLENKGVEVSAAPDVEDVKGAPLPFDDDTGQVADDDLGDRIARALEADGRIDLDAVEITVRDRVVHLEGGVDSEGDRQHLVALLRRLKGVRDVRAEALVARGVDSHIPRDADE